MIKKNYLKINDWIPLILIFVLISFLVMCFIGFKVTYDNKQEACKSEGYEKYKYKFGFEYCIDYEGNYHYVEFVTTSGFEGASIYQDGYIREISIGDVRIT